MWLSSICRHRQTPFVGACDVPLLWFYMRDSFCCGSWTTQETAHQGASPNAVVFYGSSSTKFDLCLARSMSWLFYPTCDSLDCDFSRVIGFDMHLRYGWIGFCRKCFKSVMLAELGPDDPGYMPDLLIRRVLRPLSVKLEKPKALKPKERRLLRKMKKNRSDAQSQPNPAPRYFEPTEEYLYIDKQQGLIEGVEQGACPECGERNALQVGFDNGKTPCPKCGTGVLYEFCGAHMDRTHDFAGKQEHQLQPITTFDFPWWG